VPVTNAPQDQGRVEALVGNPKTKFELLCERIQQGEKSFQAIETEFLDLIWTMDTYRREQVVPRGMVSVKMALEPPDKQLEGIYRGKGNYFSTIVALIVGEMTTSPLASRRDVQGFSQPHQIDIAWPAYDMDPIVDPLICCEAKLTGAPAYPGNKGRGAMSDWSNRRKELKFQATDLKLARHAANTSIHNWDLWRKTAPPSVYSLWAARLGPRDDVAKMIEEARILAETYTNGVGIYAFQENTGGTAYVPTPLNKSVASRVTSLDSVLGYIAAEIKQIMSQHGGKVPAPHMPPPHATSTLL
jgi:hypothetical protein